MKFSISNTIRTNNFKDAAIQEKIMGLWQQPHGRRQFFCKSGRQNHDTK